MDEALTEGVKALTLEHKALSDPEGAELRREEEVAEQALDRLDEEYSKGTLDREIQEEFAERLEQFQMQKLVEEDRERVKDIEEAVEEFARLSEFYPKAVGHFRKLAEKLPVDDLPAFPQKFNIRPIKGPYQNPAIHAEFHIAGSRGLSTCS